MKNLGTLKEFVFVVFAHFRFRFVLIIGIGILSSFLQGAGLLMIVPLIESYSNQKTGGIIGDLVQYLDLSQNLNTILLLYLFILLSYSGLKALQVLFIQKIVANFSNQYAINSTRKLLNANWEFYLKVPSSRLINLLKSEARSIKALTNQLFQLIKTLVLVIIQLFFAFLISPYFSLVLLALLTIIYLLQQFIFKRNYKLGKVKVKLSEEIQSYLNETFRGIKLIKLHQLERKRGDQYINYVKNVEKNELKNAGVNAVSDLLYTLTSAFIVISLIYLSLNYQLLPVASLLVLLVLFTRIIGKVSSIVKIIGSVNNLLPSFIRFTEIIKLAEQHSNDIQTTSDEPAELKSIELKGIEYKLENRNILTGINLKIEQGRFYILSGESGIGKTITSDLLSGLIVPEKGEIFINGDLADFKLLRNYQKEVSYVLQETLLFGDTIRNNITFFGEYTDKEIHSAIEKAGLRSLIQRLPEGLDTKIKEDNRGLSGGEMQRIAIARAIIRKSQLYIFDEVTNTLDIENETIVLSTLQALKKNSIVVLITHKNYLFDQADELIRLT